VATRSKDALSCWEPVSVPKDESKFIASGRPPLADIGDASDSVSMIRPLGDALVLLLLNELHAGEQSGSCLLAASESLGGSGLMGGSEGLPEWVLSEPSSMAFVSESGIRVA